MQVRDNTGMRAGGFGLLIVRAIADELMYNGPIKMFSRGIKVWQSQRQMVAVVGRRLF